MNEQEQFEKIKEACLSEGGKLLLQQIQEHCKAADTIKVYPVTSEEMLTRFGYVQGVEWLAGLITQYQEMEWQDELQD